MKEIAAIFLPRVTNQQKVEISLQKTKDRQPLPVIRHFPFLSSFALRLPSPAPMPTPLPLF
jgi:hypothetical protein